MFLEQLSNARGVSGNESAVRALIADQIKKYVDEYRVDALGNLVALKRASRRGGAHRSPVKILLAAHMDEVGFLITHIDSDGLLRFEKVGGIDDRVLPGKLVLIGEQGTPGVLGFRPRHLTSESERKKPIAADDLAIDIGAISHEDARRVVQPGDYATFATTFMRMGDNRARGKALDDRLGCAVLVELLHGDYPFDFYAAFTTQEEIGLRGARVAAFPVEPNAALVLEATVCDDSPKSRDVSPVTRLGSGPAITLADRGLLADKRLVEVINRTADEENIPLQFKAPGIGGTDAGRLHLTGAGIPSAVVSVPARYIHSPAALISLDDYQNALRLVRAALPNIAVTVSNLE